MLLNQRFIRAGATFGQETGVASGVWRLHDNGEQPAVRTVFFIVCVGQSPGTMLLNQRFIRAGRIGDFAEQAHN